MPHIIRTGFLLLHQSGWLFINFSCLTVLASICSAILNVSDKVETSILFLVSKENMQSLIKYNIDKFFYIYLPFVCFCVRACAHSLTQVSGCYICQGSWPVSFQSYVCFCLSSPLRSMHTPFMWIRYRWLCGKHFYYWPCLQYSLHLKTIISYIAGLVSVLFW